MMRDDSHEEKIYEDPKKSLSSRLVLSPRFQNATLVMIALNALWLAYEADHNRGTRFSEFEPRFLIVETIFIGFFTVEILLRLVALKPPRLRAFRDFSLKFD